MKYDHLPRQPTFGIQPPMPFKPARPIQAPVDMLERLARMIRMAAQQQEPRPMPTVGDLYVMRTGRMMQVVGLDYDESDETVTVSLRQYSPAMKADISEEAKALEWAKKNVGTRPFGESAVQNPTRVPRREQRDAPHARITQDDPREPGYGQEES